MTRILKTHSLFIRLGQTLAIALLLGVAATAAAAQVPSLSFSTGKVSGKSYGEASSTGGALRGTVQFHFGGYISNGSTLSISGWVRLPTSPGANKLDGVSVSQTFTTTLNRPGGPQATLSSDATYNILTITNLGATEGFAGTGGYWKGKMKLTLRFSKVSGVSDKFSVEFTPEARYNGAPAAVSGLISSASVKSNSDLRLVR